MLESTVYMPHKQCNRRWLKKKRAENANNPDVDTLN